MTKTTAHPRYHGRMRVYLSEMFPIGPRLVLSGLIAAATTLVVTHSASSAAPGNLWAFALVWFDAFALLIVLRLMDELKDLDVDRQLFASRPVPSGRTFPSDIAWSLMIVTTLYILMNTTMFGFLVVPLLALGYTYLMFKYFFLRHLIADNLLLNLITHNPVTLVITLGLVQAAATGNGLALAEVNRHSTGAFVVLVWALFFAWEIARKVRAAKEETAYVTYSQVLGRQSATLIVVASVVFATGVAAHLVNTVNLHWIGYVVIAGSTTFALMQLVRFLLSPSSRTSHLKTVIEIFLVGVLSALILGVLLGSGEAV